MQDDRGIREGDRVAARRGATFRRRELGRELKRLRERLGLTAEAVAEDLGFSQAKLSRVEKGDIPLPRISDLENLLDKYEIAEIDDRDLLLTLHRESLSKEPWTPYRHVMPSGMPTFLGLEQDARTMKAWVATVVYGLLQTEDYARALFLSAKAVEERTTEFVEHNVRVRMQRKGLITREDDPLELRVVLDESVLRRVVGDVAVMQGQYDEIARLAQLDHVTVQIMPLKLATYRAQDNFAILDFEDSLDPLVQMDTAKSITVMDRESDVWGYNRRFDAMREGALSPSQTPKFLNALSRELAKESNAF